jgi:hypothetical protein
MPETALMPPINVSGFSPDAETDEQRRQRLARALPAVPATPAQPTSAPAASPGAMPPVPVAPSRSAASPAPSAGRPTLPPVKPVAALVAPDLGHSALPPVPVNASPTSAVNPAPAMPPVPIQPAQAQPPELHGWKKALDVIGSMFPIGRAIETAIPGTPQNFNWKQAMEAARTETGQRIAKNKQELEAAPREEELHKRNVESEISSRGNKDEAALAKIGMKRDANGEIVPDEESEIYKGQQSKISSAEDTAKNINALRQAQTELAQARTEVEKAKNDKNSPAYKQAEQRLTMAQQAHAVAAQNLGLHQQEFENKLHEQDLVKPSGQSQSRASAAQAVLGLYPSLEVNVRKNAASMGPLMGRLARGKIAIGNVPPDVANLYAAMKSFYALQPAVHGFRNAEFVKDFETALGTLERDPEAFIAGMQGLKPTLESVAKEGKTFHKRIVEGEGGTAGGKTWNPKTGKYE